MVELDSKKEGTPVIVNLPDYRRDKRQFRVITLIVFLGFVGISMPYLIFPPLFLNASYSFLPVGWSVASRSLFLGITLAAYPFGQFVGSPILGALSDQYGRKKMMSRSLVLAGFCYFLTGIAIWKQQLTLLIISRFIAGLMEGNIAIARAMAADLKTIPKHSSFGKINAASSIAYLVGPILGGALAQGNSCAAPFFLICLFFIGLATLSSFVLKASTLTTPVPKETIGQKINLFRRMGRLFANNKQLQFLMAMSTIFTLAIDIFYEFESVYLTVKWMLIPSQLVIYNSIACLGLIIGNGWLPTLFVKSQSKWLPTLCAIVGFACLLFGVVATNSPIVMMLLFFGCGIFIGVGVTMLTVKISDSVPDAIQGEVMGTQQSLRVFADGMICLFGGALLIISSHLILIVAALLALSAVGYFAVRYKKIFSIPST